MARPTRQGGVGGWVWGMIGRQGGGGSWPFPVAISSRWRPMDPFDPSRNPPDPHVQMDGPPDLAVVAGPSVVQVTRRFSDYAWLTTRLRPGQRHVELEWAVGPLPSPRDVVLRVATDLATEGVWYTDANGREQVARRRNDRATWTMPHVDPPAENDIGRDYYPVTAAAHIEDGVRGVHVSLLTDRAQGKTSWGGRGGGGIVGLWWVSFGSLWLRPTLADAGGPACVFCVSAGCAACVRAGLSGRASLVRPSRPAPASHPCSSKPWRLPAAFSHPSPPATPLSYPRGAWASLVRPAARQRAAQRLPAFPACPHPGASLLHPCTSPVIPHAFEPLFPQSLPKPFPAQAVRHCAPASWS